MVIWVNTGSIYLFPVFLWGKSAGENTFILRILLSVTRFSFNQFYWKNNGFLLISNIHVFKTPKDKGNIKKHFSSTKKFYFPEELQAGFHVWGLEWTPEYIRFYIDGILFREAENTHWH